jgi:hypothetical protein
MILCDLCTKGWIRNPDNGWFDACPVCGGLGKLSWERVSELLKMPVSTIRGVTRARHKTRAKTARKIIERVMAIVEPKQPDLFGTAKRPIFGDPNVSDEQVRLPS